jgi:MinD-like ATPase involved in chromosome partitioning or flagellar assembly
MTADPASLTTRLASVPVQEGPPEPTSTLASSAPRHADTRRASAGEFLHRREVVTERQPATWGWRGRLARYSGGAIAPQRSRAERRFDDERAAVQREFDGPRTIAFLNPKGGAAKTTGVLAAGYTFGTVRGGGVVAWDNNETRGTLGIRALRNGSDGSHQNTTRELLEDLGRFSGADARIGDLASYVRGQGDAHFDVLASDERPGVTGTIRAQDFADVHHLLERFYRVILVDTGNNMRAENWLAAAEAADLLVVTSTVREDTGYSGLWMLDALQDAGYENLKYKTLTVLSDPADRVDADLARDLAEVYGQRTRGVHRVPFDPALVSGSVVPYRELSRETTRAWLSVCAGMAAAL